jgi:6-pyruvoyltetrahydropterin/6-carboxytetrahydropterin synthase
MAGSTGGRERRPAGDFETDEGTMFEISVEESFSAGHALRGYKGKCENPHGHNYKIRVTLEGDRLDGIGLLCDFAQVRRVIREVMNGLDHQFLNEIEPFKQINPSAENIAKYFYEAAARQLEGEANGARLASVTVWETDETTATYRPENAGVRPRIGPRRPPKGRRRPRPAKAGR